MTPRLVVLDRDGTLVQVPHGTRYLAGEDPIVFVPGAVEFVRQLNRAHVGVVVVTNQQGIALREYPAITHRSVRQFHDRLQQRLLVEGAWIDRFYVCPHRAAEECGCRKPRAGLLEQALRDFGVPPSESVAVGDQPRDCQAAHAAGIRHAYLFQGDWPRLVSGDS